MACSYETITKIDSKYWLRIPKSGGKAGKGNAKTSNVQVFNLITRFLEKQFQFKTADWASKISAIDKATKYCHERNLTQQTTL